MEMDLDEQQGAKRYKQGSSGKKVNESENNVAGLSEQPCVPQ